MTEADGQEGETDDVHVLLKILTAQFNALVAAKGDQRVVRLYCALLRFLKSQANKFLDRYEPAKDRPGPSSAFAGFSEEVLQKASLSDLEQVVNDESTPRRQLGRIAIRRFSVPRGSMPSFSNRQALTDKLRSLIENERAHETIAEVARRQAKRSLQE